MKKILFFIIIAFCLSANAQTTALRKRTLTESTIVQDSAGIQYPYAVWKKLISSGNYRLKALNPASDSTAFVLVKMTEAQKNEMATRMPKPAESHFFTTGEKIKLFNAYDIKGTKVKLKDFKDKVIVLNFWFIGCPPCRQEIPELNEIAMQYANDPDVVFVAVALDPKDNIEQFLKGNPFGYHIIEDGKEFAEMYKINLYPTNVVLDKEGKVKFHSSGYAFNTPFWIKRTIEEAEKSGI